MLIVRKYFKRILLILITGVGDMVMAKSKAARFISMKKIQIFFVKVIH